MEQQTPEREVAREEGSSKKERCLERCHETHGYGRRGGAGEAVYGLGIIGTAIYYIQHAPGFWVGVLGILKAIIWPAILTYHLFSLLKL